MRRSLVSGHALLAAIFLATSVTARSSNTLLSRDATCPDTTQSHCTQAGVPENFCCPATTTCIPLAGNTTVLCCPKGSNCGTIKPVTCDLSAQNATLYIESTLKTTALAVPLLTCGGLCCPFGYSCNNSGNCVVNADQQAIPGPPASSPSSSSSRSSTTSSVTSSSPSKSSASTSPPVVISSACSNFPTTAVLAGFFPGLAAGILLSIAGVLVLGSCRRKAARRRSTSSLGNISAPQPSRDMRTDFLRKLPQTPSTIVGSERRHTVQRMKSIFTKTPGSPEQSPQFTPPLPLNVQRPMVHDNRPVTPPFQRDPSYEDIDIFADDDTVSSLGYRERANGSSNGNRLAPPRVSHMRDSHQTTFSDMMDRSGLAGLQKGQPYVYQ